MGFGDWLKYDLKWGIEDKLFDAKIKARGIADVFKEASVEAKEGIEQAGKEFVDLIGDGVEQLTGQDKVKEAELIYERQIKKYERTIKLYNSTARIVEESLSESIFSINKSKSNIYKEILPRFVCIADRIEDVYIKSKFQINNNININQIRGQYLPTKSSVINKLSRQSIIFAIAISPTLGILKMRKDAKDSLQRAYELECEIKLEIEKIFAEKDRIENISSALKNVSIYFQDMREITLKLIETFEEKFNQLEKNDLSLYRRDGSNKFDLELLPKDFQNYYEACLNLCIVLKEMGLKAYLKNDLIITSEVEELSDRYDEFRKINMEMEA
ncbi:MAG: hypothetical protein E6423_10945 [Clostridium sp.]|nr:hypothetical protein [Clostridium sp.]